MSFLRHSRPKDWTAVLLTIVTLAVGATVDWHFSRGFDVRWFTATGSGRHAFAHTRERVASFRNYRRPLGRILGYWDFDQAGVPTDFPNVDASLRTTLRLPAAGRLQIETPNEATIFVDGRDYRGERLLAGDHALAITWRAESFADNSTHWDRPEPMSLRLFFEQGLSRTPVPRSWLHAPPSWSTRLTVWALTLIVCLWIAFVHRRHAWRDLTFRVALLGVLGIAALCRFYAYDVSPDFKDNDDELFATWNGWSLLDQGVTRGWTLWPNRYTRQFEIEKTPYFRQRPFFVVTPYLEHPPAMHLLAGAAAKVGGARHWLHARLRHVRLVPIVLSLLSLGLLFLVARELALDRSAVLLSGLWFASTPHIALQQRVVKEEALVAPVLLVVVWLCLLFARTRQLRTLWWAAAFAGLSIFIKVPAFAISGVVAGFALAYRGPREAIRCLTISALLASGLLLYAWAIDWDAFWHVQGTQASVRRPHWNIFFRFFAEPLINHDRVGAGWQLLSWFATAAAAFMGSRRTQLTIVLPVMLYMVAIAIPSGSWNYGWYALPLYPFLSLGIGIILSQTIRDLHPFWISLLIFLGLFYTFTFFLPDETLEIRGQWSTIRMTVAATTAALLVPTYWNWLRPNPYLKALCQGLLVGVLAIQALLSCAIVLDYEDRIDDFANLDLEANRDRPIPGPYWKR